MLKFSYITLILLLKAQISLGQNLIYNPSFELHDTCPDNYSQYNRVQNWIWIPEFETPDYFNSCATDNSFAIPNNIFGFQEASSGNAYVGLFFYGYDQTLDIDYREYISCSFNPSLIIGTKYYVTFKVSPTTSNENSNRYAIDKVCMLFTTNLFVPTLPLTFINYAQIYPDSIITNTSEWTTISGSFVADSSYNFITIGNFFADSLTTTATIGGTYTVSYYYVDDVCVSTDSLTCALFTGLEEKEQSKLIKIYPNPNNGQMQMDYLLPEGNKGVLQLVDFNGRMLQSYMLSEGFHNLSINIKEYTQGIYFAFLYVNGEYKYSEKIVVIE